MNRFAADKVNFGLSTDDPGIIATSMNQEFLSASTTIGLTEEQLIASVYNAARSCFLPDDEKQDLVAEIDKLIEQYHKTK